VCHPLYMCVTPYMDVVVATPGRLMDLLALHEGMQARVCVMRHRVSGRAHTPSWVYRRRAHGSSTHSLTHMHHKPRHRPI
jgi:hypothetical protein